MSADDGTGTAARPRSPAEDRTLAHQVVIRFAAGRQHLLAVSCNCLGRRNLAVARQFGPGEPIRLWRTHMIGR